MCCVGFTFSLAFALLLPLFNTQSTDTLVRLDNATATSLGDPKDCSPTNALRRGSRLWCSAGHHAASQVVAWSGSLRTARLAKGIRVHWGYSPGEYRVEISQDGEKFTEVTSWETSRRSERRSKDVLLLESFFLESYNQDILLPQPLRVSTIKIFMRRPRHGIYGINFISLISDGSTLVVCSTLFECKMSLNQMLVSGVTSAEGEMCLQTENGGRYAGSPVVLDFCSNAIAAADGREIFRFSSENQIVHEVTNLCLALENNDETNGGNIVLGSCRLKSQNLGESQWQILPDNRLKILRTGDWCLSQEGFKAGSADEAVQKMTKSSYSRVNDALHDPTKAVDGNPKTFWGSQEFDFPFAVPLSVDFSIDLGGEFKLQNAEIDWVYPAAEYEIFLSKDGRNWTSVAINLANSFNNTIDNLQGKISRYVTLKMYKPHPSHSVISGRALYGLSRFSIFVNRLRSIIEPCEKARESLDARDKYFAVFVAEFDREPGLSVLSSKSLFTKTRLQLEMLLNQLGALQDPIKQCLDNFKILNQKLLTNKAFLNQKKAMFGRLLRTYSNIFQDVFTSNEIATTIQRGGGTDVIIPEDCTDVMVNNPESPSGFYNILPPCQTTVIRVYCDMTTRKSLYIYHGDPPQEPGTFLQRELYRSEEIPLKCSKFGLIPFTVESAEEVQRIQTLLRLMKFDINPNNLLMFPIGSIRRDTGNVLALDSITDISKLMTGVFEQVKEGFDSVGVTTNTQGLAFFRWATAAIGGALCATKKSFLEDSSITALDCAEAPRNNPKFQACPFESMLVKCLDTCASKQTQSSNVIGAATYRDDSPVCLAAIHAGALGKHNVVKLTFMPGLRVYEGSFSNGVRSHPYRGALWDRSFRVDLPQQKCIIKNNNLIPKENQSLQVENVFKKSKENALTETTQVSSVPSTTNKSDGRDGITPVSSIEEFSQELINATSTTEETTTLVLYKFQQMNGISDDITQNVFEAANEKLSIMRGLTKPSENLKTSLETQSQLLEPQVLRTANLFLSLQRRALDELEETQALLRMQHSTFRRLWGFKSLELPSIAELLTSKFWSTFSISPPAVSKNFNSKNRSLSLPSKEGWFMSTGTAALHRKDSLAMLAYAERDALSYNRALGVAEYPGLYISDYQFSNLRLFDGILSLDFFVEKGTGTLSIAFRRRDNSNMYLYEVRQDQGLKRLVKVVNGRIFELARKHDGGFINNVWYSIQVRTTMNVIKILSGESNRPLTTIFEISDGSHIAGSIGFFAYGIDVYLDSLSYIADSCKENIVPAAPPAPVSCSIYKFEHVDYLYDQWHVINPPKAEAQGLWAIKPNIGGRQKVIVQYTAVTGSEDEYGTLAILKRNRFCISGIFSVDFFPQCNGLVGLVIRYKNPQHFIILEIATDMVRARAVRKGKGFQLLHTTSSRVVDSARYIMGEWNNAAVEFNKKQITLTLNGYNVLDVSLPSDLEEPLEEYSRVGLSAWRCGGIAFNKISLLPLMIEPVEYLELQEKENTVYLDNEDFLVQNNTVVVGSNFPPPAPPPRPYSSTPPVSFEGATYRNNATTTSAMMPKQCKASHIINRLQQCRLILSQFQKKNPLLRNQINTNLVSCQYNFCDTCCQYFLPEILLKVSIKLPQRDLVEQHMRLIQNQCLLDCSRGNSEAQETYEILNSAISKCLMLMSFSKHSQVQFFQDEQNSEIMKPATLYSNTNSQQLNFTGYIHPYYPKGKIIQKSFNFMNDDVDKDKQFNDEDMVDKQCMDCCVRQFLFNTKDSMNKKLIKECHQQCSEAHQHIFSTI